MIKGNSVYLRPINEKDIESIHMCFQDEEILYMTGTKKRLTKEEIGIDLKQFSKDSTRNDFAICLIDTNKIIGDLSITEIDLENNKAMFRIAIHNKEYFGKGYGTEATSLAQKFTFEQLKLNRLELQVFSHNMRGMKSYEKSGFKREGILRQSLFVKDQYSDEIIMSMLYEEYLSFKKNT
ncbi:GNAT family N-acetyltransferase [Peribacillus sp. TH16]|uniref:GNAT family N-acetyltransferase n=1 Tax=Peribacillus sp. TH16 TaxID=2798482 RepID=UPI001913AE8B|nr:GNAT family protein [Peribacillus sp. TH16]MBK5482050.1 GNAT family N-acetyltransferase [Peribacillus sp. TH16]